jgi:hypothetical protein
LKRSVGARPTTTGREIAAGADDFRTVDCGTGCVGGPDKVRPLAVRFEFIVGALSCAAWTRVAARAGFEAWHG